MPLNGRERTKRWGARLDRDVEAAVPNYREIDQDPRWRAWLRMPDPHTGAVRQTILDDAIAQGSASRVVAFFRGFERDPKANSTRTNLSSKGGARLLILRNADLRGRLPPGEY